MGQWILMVVFLCCFALFNYPTACKGQYSPVTDVRIVTTNSTRPLQFLSPIPGVGWTDVCFSYRSSLNPILEVVCNTLGYDSDIARISYSISYSLSENTFLYDMSCTGKSFIADCDVTNYYRRTYCDHVNQVICPTCRIGAVRLTSGLVPEQGYVEVCLNGSWSRMCARNWGYSDSFVICRQLGYPATKAGSVGIRYAGRYAGFVPSDLVYDCVGNETNLLECAYLSSSSCPISSEIIDPVFVYCRGDVIVNTNCITGAVRLSGGRDQYEGRVEVCSSNGVWGSVSRSYWDSNDAKVVCRQLGMLQFNLVTRITLPYFGRGAGPRVIQRFDCNGAERSLANCPHTMFYFLANSVAGVRCQANPSPVQNCINGEVHLVNGPSSSEGRVEMCYNGIWGSICNIGWNNQDAAVVCRQLGFQAENSTALRTHDYDEGRGPYLLDSVSCRRHERNLTECGYRNSQIGYHVCSSGQDAGVRCDTSVCSHGDVRLYGGYSKVEGVAEVCVNGQWVNMCYNNWRTSNSEVFCKQWTGRENVVGLHDTCCRKKSPTTSTMLINVDCPSNRSNPRFIQDCSYSLIQGYSSSGCSLTSSVILGCYDIDGCINGSVRLSNSDLNNEGIVEICINGIWGSITSRSWNTPDAEVVCRQLGLPWNWSHYFSVVPSEVTSPRVIDSLYCNGQEDTLWSCRYRRRLSLSTSSRSGLDYSHFSVAAVSCQGNSSEGGRSDCSFGDVRLGNASADNMEGRVEICDGGVWFSVCDNNWGPQETHVFCRQLLGHQVSGSFEVTQGYYEVGNGPILCQIRCDSANFSSCQVYHQGSSCYSEKAVGVVCTDTIVYTVSVTSNSTGPVEIGSRVLLECSVDPDPSLDRPVQLHYRWRGNNGLWSSSSSSPSVTVVISVAHYETSHYFCEVSISGSILGVGSTVVKVRGILNPGEIFYNQSQQNSTSLEVNITDTEEAKYQTRELNWYYNGNQLLNSTATLITNGNCTLTTAVSDGVYEARYDGLLQRPHDRNCEKMILDNLRHYPIFKPARFLIRTHEVPQDFRSFIVISKTGGRDGVFGFKENDDISLTAVGQISGSILPSEVDIYWFLNGARVYSGLSSVTRKYNSVYRNFTKVDATYVDGGTYEAHLVWSVDIQKCPLLYTYLPIWVKILAKTEIKLNYYSALEYFFTASKQSLSPLDKVSLLTCSVSLEYPTVTSISIVKNNTSLKTTSTSPLTVSTDSAEDGPFGQYQCIVNVTTGKFFLLNLLMKGRAFVRIEMMLDAGSKCKTDEIFVLELKAGVATRFNEGCSCNVSAADFQDASVQCRSARDVVFTATLVFSTDSGDETALTLTNRLSQLASLSALTVNVNGTEALITSACSSSSCSANDGASKLLGFGFGFFILGAVVCAMCIAIVIVIIKKINQKKNAQSLPTAPTESEKRYATGGRQQPQSKPDPKAAKNKPKVADHNPKVVLVDDKDVYDTYEMMDTQNEEDLYDCVN